MKNILPYIFILFALFLIIPAHTVQAFVFTRDLELSMVGEDVKELQKYLNGNGFTLSPSGMPGSSGNETTIFGYATKAALQRFQASKGLPSTGYFGPLTRGILGEQGSIGALQATTTSFLNQSDYDRLKKEIFSEFRSLLTRQNDSIVDTLSRSSGSSEVVDVSGDVSSLSSSVTSILSDLGTSETIVNTIIRAISPGVVGSKYTVTTLAGTAGSVAHTDGTGSDARFSSPKGGSVDSLGNFYVVDNSCGSIRKVTPDGVVTTIAGPNTGCGFGNSDGASSTARFTSPSDTTVDSQGNVFVSDTSNCTIRKITPDGVVSTLAGAVQQCSHSDGIGSSARFKWTTGLAVDSNDNIIVTSYNGCTIRKVTQDGVVTTIAGSSEECSHADGVGADARFWNPSGIAVDSEDNMYTVDESGHTVRKITPEGVVTTLAGNPGVSGNRDGVGQAAEFNVPSWTAVDNAGNVYLSDYLNHTLRKVTPEGVATTLAGWPGVSGSDDGKGNEARLFRPDGIAVDQNDIIYVTDRNNSTIRKIVSP